ncbi:hypothetical protein DICPUDRAFT_99752 [Dictyostelium purpureum]|uniref:Cytochrome b5 heme-binding domain-containing protein n=1 Tax=Dictyostelium purpureum TaxID=5786 RepID=F1A272_DICPU|nr:uncharacterized protein DICPUDRAFT_99752 [Dictyostelium purpureum]EGC29703.1 hypothetical protein DICPUDRAFT_99752 [Dictyostelium purpureum]|eukprot:XP_003293768.1 hypothetical protein DICPUDRAFT_99752 [Dictyostelium purpureum]
MSEKTYTKEEVAKHCSLDDLWIVYNDDVFDVTKFVVEHPGGEEVLKGNGGKDATQEFDDVGHSASAIAKMEALRIGRIAGASPRVEKKKEVKKVTSTPVRTAPKESGGLGLLKIPIFIIVLAIVAYFFMGEKTEEIANTVI